MKKHLVPLLILCLLILFAFGPLVYAQTTTHPTVNSVTAIKNGGTAAATTTGALDNLFQATTTQANPSLFVRDYSGSATGYFLQNNYVFNADPILMPKFSTCVAKVQANAGNCRVLLIGDSTTYGVGSNGAISTGNLVAASTAPDLAAAFRANGINATYDAWWAGYATGGAIQTPVNDGRITQGSSWTQNASTFLSIGGYFLQASTTTNAFTFKPTDSVDTCRLWYGQLTGGGTLSIDISGTGTTTASTGSGTGLNSVTATGTKGINTCNAKYVSGGTVYIIGMEAWDSTKSAVIFEDAGWSGADITNQTQSNSGKNWSLVTGGLTAPAFDAVGVNSGINDWDRSIGTGLYKTDFQTVISAITSSGADAFIVTPFPTNPASFSVPQATQVTYINQLYSLAETNNIPLVDVFALYQSYAVSQPLGLYADTFTHPNNKGYWKAANLTATFLQQIAGGYLGQNPSPSASNVNGYSFDIFSGISTGTGTSGINFWTFPAGSSGTVQNYPVNTMSLSSAGNLSLVGTLGVTGAATIGGALTVGGNLTTNITGSTQCLAVNSAGLISGTGSPCGSGGGGSPGIPVQSFQWDSAGSFSGSTGLYYSTTRQGVDSLANVTTANVISLGNNGADLSSYAVGASALLAQTATNGKNNAFGSSALAALTTGADNTAMGDNASSKIVTDSRTTSFGSGALLNENIGNSSTGGNTAFGYHALTTLSTQLNDAAFGYNACNAATTGAGQNTCIGYNAGGSNASGVTNTFVGYNAGSAGNGENNDVCIGGGSCAGLSNSAGGVCVGEACSIGSATNGNVVIGLAAGSTGMGSNNTIVAAAPGTSSLTGAGNIIMGQGASKLTSGSNNIEIGKSVATTNLTTGSNNIIMGISSACDASAAGASNELHICGTAGDSLLATGMGTLATEAFTLRGTLVLSDIASDATHTDATICEDTTTHQLYSGSGTLGICLGTSSARYKNNIVQLSSSLERLMKLRPVTFNLDAAHGDPKKTQFGFIAEDAADVFPDLVGLDKDGKPNSFDYVGLISPIVKALQEQQQEISILSPGLAPYHRCVSFLPVLCAD